VFQKLGVEQVRKWGEVLAFPETGTPKQPVNPLSTWRIEYCYVNK